MGGKIIGTMPCRALQEIQPEVKGSEQKCCMICISKSHLAYKDWQVGVAVELGNLFEGNSSDHMVTLVAASSRRA